MVKITPPKGPTVIVGRKKLDTHFRPGFYDNAHIKRSAPKTESHVQSVSMVVVFDFVFQVCWKMRSLPVPFSRFSVVNAAEPDQPGERASPVLRKGDHILCDIILLYFRLNRQQKRQTATFMKSAVVRRFQLPAPFDRFSLSHCFRIEMMQNVWILVFSWLKFGDFKGFWSEIFGQKSIFQNFLCLFVCLLYGAPDSNFKRTVVTFHFFRIMPGFRRIRVCSHVLAFPHVLPA